MGRKKKKNDWKDRDGVVYSTNDSYDYEYEGEEEVETLPPSEQYLKVTLDKKARAGKQVTLISGFEGSEDDLKSLGKQLKSKCGAGGSVKDGEILIQGDFRKKVKDVLDKEGYHVKLAGG